MSGLLFTEDEHTAVYSKYRINCSEDIVKAVIEYGAKRGMVPPFDHILDVGCGSGQATNVFAPNATKITAIDISENQIKHAKLANQYDHVTYCVGTAECLPVEDNSVDVINSSQAIHWVDLDKFYKECERVLKPNGFISLNGYNGPKFVAIYTTNTNSSQDTTKLIQLTNDRLEKDNNELPYHDLIQRLHNRYQDIYECLPSKNKVRVDIPLPCTWTLDRFIGEWYTRSGYQTLMTQVRERLQRDNGRVDEEELKKHDVVKLLIEYIREIWGIKQDNKHVKVDLEWDMFAILSDGPFINK